MSLMRKSPRRTSTFRRAIYSASGEPSLEEGQQAPPPRPTRYTQDRDTRSGEAVHVLPASEIPSQRSANSDPMAAPGPTGFRLWRGYEPNIYEPVNADSDDGYITLHNDSPYDVVANSSDAELDNANAYDPVHIPSPSENGSEHPSLIYHDLDCHDEEEDYESVGGIISASSSNDSSSEEYETIETYRRDVNSKGAQDDVDSSKQSVSSTSQFLRNITTTISKHWRQRPSVSTGCILFNFDKHPPPSMPDVPDGLTEKQMKRRHIVTHMVEIENSYVDSLVRLIQEYKQPLLDNPNILPKERVEFIFDKLDDILACHLMFRIALEDKIKDWDEHEELGAQFSECFQKQMILDCYSEFVNHFMEATDMFRKSIEERPQLKSFVEETMKQSQDKTTCVGLMLKCVQRFPQYILQVKDLLKYTPPDHNDYMHLNTALSTLENVAHQLNEKKRTSEEKLAAKVMLNKFNIKSKDSVLLRQDDVFEVEYGPKGEILKRKQRRLLLFNDQLCCINVEKNTGAPASEKLTLKWHRPINCIDYHETSITPNMGSVVMGRHGSLVIETAQSRSSSSSDNLLSNSAVLVRQELLDLLHDRSVLSQIQLLVSSLHQPYEGLSQEAIANHMTSVATSVKLLDEQLQMLDSCTIVLNTTTPNSGRAGSKRKYIFQMLSPENRQDWVLDLRAVKLARDPNNQTCWICDVPLLKYPLMVKQLGIDVTREYTKVTCAVPVYLSTATGSVGLQYLWVCSGKDGRGQVTLVSLHSNQPSIIESFKACNGEIVRCVLVTSSVHSHHDHVWMADSTNQLHIHSIKDSQRFRARRCFYLPAKVTDMCCYGNHVYIGLENGTVHQYSKFKEYELSLDTTDYAGDSFVEPKVRKLGSDAVTRILPLENNKLLAACGSTLYEISAARDLPILDKHPLENTPPIEDMVRLGHGLWVFCRNCPKLRLYHSENYCQLHMDVHMGSALSKLLPAALPDPNSVYITCLCSTTGLLWVGMSTGHILTVPVPVLDGVPIVSGRISLASFSHSGPVQFIVPVRCSITFSRRVAASAADDSRVPWRTQSVGSDVDRLQSTESETDFSLDFPDSKLPPSEPPIAVDNKRRQSSRFKFMAKRGKGKQKAAESLAALNGQTTPSTSKALNGQQPQAGAIGRMYNKQAQQMYSSLMRLDDIDSSTSACDIVSSLIPTNAVPVSRLIKHTTICRRRPSTVMETDSRSTLNLTRARVTQSSRAISMIDLNEVYVPFGEQASWFTRPLSALAGESLNEVPEDEECTEEEAEVAVTLRKKRMPQVDSCEEQGYCGEPTDLSVQQAFEQSYDELDHSSYRNGVQCNNGEEEPENSEAIMETNFLKATLIISGGQGFMSQANSNERVQSESTLIIWQQTQPWI